MAEILPFHRPLVSKAIPKRRTVSPNAILMFGLEGETADVAILDKWNTGASITAPDDRDISCAILIEAGSGFAYYAMARPAGSGALELSFDQIHDLMQDGVPDELRALWLDARRRMLGRAAGVAR